MKRIALALAVVLVASTTATLAAEITQTVRLDSRELELVNMIGEITVEPAPGDEFVAEITIRGEDAEEGLVQVVVDEGRQGRILLKFPVDEHDDYVYPPLGDGQCSFTIGDDDGSWLDELLGALKGDRITVRGHGRGLEVWADVTLQVPQGREASVQVRAGNIAAASVRADLSLDTASGPITVRDHEGDLVCDTGSGGVRVQDHQGDELKIDTGSGGVRVDNARTGYLYVDTGSGGVRAHGVAADRARIDTGSGAVVLALDRMGTGDFVIDTGSGGVELAVPRDASADIRVDVGSGSIDCSVPGAEILRKERDELHVRIGGGAADVVIDTGSGSVDIRPSEI